jgi:hypothetical protein
MAKLEAEVRKLVSEECASHSRECNGVQNHCCARRDERCSFYYGDSSGCSYFEKAVLPLKPELEAIYHAEKKARAGGYSLTKLQRKLVAEGAEWAGKARVVCEDCGQSFPARSNRQKRCERCQKQAIREQNRQRQINKRKRAG